MQTTRTDVSNSDGGWNIELREILYSVRRRKWIVLLSTVVVAAAAALGTLRLPKIYRATAQILIEPALPKVLDDTMTVDDFSSQVRAETLFYNTQHKVLLSRAVMQDAIARMGLESDEGFLKAYGLADATDDTRVNDILAVLGQITSVSSERNSRVADLVVEDRDADRAARIANNIAQAYIDYTLSRRLESNRSASKWLDQRANEFATKLEEAERALYEFKRDNMLVSVSLQDRENITAAGMATLNEKLLENRTKLIELRARKEILKRQSESGDIQSAPSISRSPVIEKLKSSLLELDKTRAELATRYGARHPKMVAVENQTARTQAHLKREIALIAETLDNDIAGLKNAQRHLEGAMGNEKDRVMHLNNLALEYSKLTRDFGTTQTIYQSLLKRQVEADLAGSLKTNFASWLETAEPVHAPVRPSMVKNLALGIMAGLALGMLIAIASVLLDNTVRSQEDVEHLLRIPFLGVLPAIGSPGQEKGRLEGKSGASQDRDLYIIRNPKSSAAECARSIRTNLLFLGTDKPLKRLLFTSAGPVEGKTTTVTALGITMAQAGNRVLIVDSDLRRPRLHRTFGVSGEKGLTNVLVETATLDQAIKSTEVMGLDLLPCGPMPPNPAELLHSERFARLLRDLDARYDRVLLDSPPVGAVTDAAILSQSTDGTVFVIQASGTPKDAARRAARLLRDVEANILGCVLNNVNFAKDGYGGHYHYYYYHRYGYGADEAVDVLKKTDIAGGAA